MFLALLSVPASAGLVDTTPAALALTGSKSSGGSFVDLDQDGDWDLIAPGDGQIHVLRNDGGNAWTDITASSGSDLSSLLAPRGMFVGDIDHDGFEDLIHVNISLVTVLT